MAMSALPTTRCHGEKLGESGIVVINVSALFALSGCDLEHGDGSFQNHAELVLFSNCLFKVFFSNRFSPNNEGEDEPIFISLSFQTGGSTTNQQ